MKGAASELERMKKKMREKLNKAERWETLWRLRCVGHDADVRKHANLGNTNAQGARVLSEKYGGMGRCTRR